MSQVTSACGARLPDLSQSLLQVALEYFTCRKSLLHVALECSTCRKSLLHVALESADPLGSTGSESASGFLSPLFPPPSDSGGAVMRGYSPHPCNLPGLCGIGLGFAFVYPKGPCGTTCCLKLRFCLPKRPLRDDFLAKNQTVSAQKAPAGRPSS